MNNKRIEWIDCAKFFGILLVILGHHCISGFVGGLISAPIIFSFHMPLFFFINGITQKTEIDVDKYIKKRFDKLVIPYIIATVMAVVTNSYLRQLIFVDMLKWTDYAYEAKDIIINSLVYWNGFGQLWFIPCLLITELLYCLTFPWLNKKSLWEKYIVLYALGLLGVVISHIKSLTGIVTMFQFPVALIALIFIYIGNDYANKRFKLRNSMV